MIGTTFNHLDFAYLGLDPKKSLDTALSMNFSYIRLNSYWNRIEPEPNNYQFSNLHSLLEKCQQAQQKVVLTVGVKAPRWPEFHWPDYIPPEHRNLGHTAAQNKLLQFIDTTVNACQKFSCITHWQVENEPLNKRFLEKKKIPFDFLKKEVSLVRSLDQRPIIINLWGNRIRRRLLSQAEKLADVIGLNIYQRRFVIKVLGRSIYRGPCPSYKRLAKILSESQHPVWVTELQAEPWEIDEAAYFSQNPGSLSPAKLRANFKLVKKLPVEQVLLWGLKYWLWQAKQGNDQYLDVVENLIKQE